MNALGPKQFINSICDICDFFYLHTDWCPYKNTLKKAYYDNEKKICKYCMWVSAR